MRNGVILLIFHTHIYLAISGAYPVQCWASFDMGTTGI